MTADELAQLREDMDEDMAWAMTHDEMLERRIAALEEIVAARWPRRILVRRRLARDLRASVRHYSWAGPEWFWRRAQAAGDELIAADLDDGTEPYCTVCGAPAGLFQGTEGWQHYRGEGTAASPVQPYGAGHAPVIGWRQR